MSAVLRLAHGHYHLIAPSVPPPPAFRSAVATPLDSSAGLPTWHPGGRDSLTVELRAQGAGGAALGQAGCGGGGGSGSGKNGTVVTEVPRLKTADSLDVFYRWGPGL